MKKILLMQLNSVRNVIFSLPLIKILREVYPEAELSYLAANEHQPLVADNIYLDQVLTVDKTRFQRLKKEQSLWAAVGSLRPTISHLRGTKFDLIIDLQNDWASNLLAYLAKAKQRIGVKKRLGSLLYTTCVDRCEGHLADDYLQLLSVLDINLDKHRPEFGLAASQPRQEYIKRLLAKHDVEAADPLIAFNPGAGAGTAWPEEKFIKLGDWLLEELDARLAIIGNDLSAKQIERITSKINGRVLNLTDQLDWSELAQFLRRADLLVAGNNPCAHLAQAVDTPVLALFGTEDVGRVGPYGGHSMVVKSSDGQIANISVEAVINNLNTMLKW